MASSSSHTRKLAAQIQKATTPPHPVPAMVKGVVTAWNPGDSPPTVTVQLSGASDGNTAKYQYLNSYWPLVGDTVQIVSRAGKHLVLGSVEYSSGLSNWNQPSFHVSVTSVGGGGGPLLMRLVNDRGYQKIQIKGSVSIGNGCTNPQGLFTFSPAPAQARLIVCVVDKPGTRMYVNYGTNGVANLWGSDGTTTCAILDGHEFFLQ